MALIGWDETKKIALTIGAANISADLTDFPVLVNLGIESGITNYDCSEVFAELGINQGEVTTTPPIAHWTFDGVTGTTVIDEKGTYDGTIIGSPTVDPGGKFDNFLNNGASSGNRMALTSALAFKSISMWIKRNVLTTYSCFLSNSSSTVGIFLISQPDGNVYVYNSGDKVTDLYITDTEWHHVCIIENTSGNDHYVYVDGVRSSSSVNSGLLGTFINLGRPDLASGHENSDCDNVQVFDYKLTQADIDALYAAGNTSNKKIAFEIGNTAVETYAEIERWSYSHDDYTKLLIHSDTVDGSTSFSDSSTSEHTVSPYGNTHHEVDQAKIGKTGIYFDGVGDYLSIPYTSDFDFGLTDFTVDFWVNFVSTGITQRICGQGNGASLDASSFRINTSNTFTYSFYTGDTFYSIISVTAIQENTWTHLAVTRNGDLLSVYIDGVLDNTVTLTARPLVTTLPFSVGRMGTYDSQYFKGYIDEFRLSKGIVRWTGDFTPPSVLYTPEGRAQLHVKVPSVTAAGGAVLNLYYDSTHADNTTYIGDTGSAAAQNVWDSNFTAVYHMAQDPSGTAPQILDSTSNANHGTSYGTMTSADLVDGLVGKAIEFDGVDDYIDLGSAQLVPEYNTYNFESFFLENSSSGSLCAGGASGDTWGLEFAYNLYYIVCSNALVTVSVAPIQEGVLNHVVLCRYSSNEFLAHINGARDPASAVDTGPIRGCTNGYAEKTVLGSRFNNGAADTFLDGSIEEVRISNIVRSDAWIATTNLTLRDTLLTLREEFLPGIRVNALIQLYDFPVYIIGVYIEQLYALTFDIQNTCEQIYSFKLLSFVAQYYGDSPTISNYLRQYYESASLLTNRLSQNYEDALLSRQSLDQAYTLTKTTINKLVQTYGISANVLHAINEAVYNIELNNQVKASTVLPYNIFNDSVLLTLSTSITIGNSTIDVDSLDISFSQSEYCGSCDLTLTDEQAFLSAEYLDDIQIVVQGEVFDFILISKSDSNSLTNKTYSIQGKSKAVLLDFPYATEILDDSLVVGKSSEIVSSLANLYGQNITWNIPADSILTQIDFQTTGKSPLQAIKEIVNSFGGVVQSLPNGDLVALPNYQVDTDKYYKSSLSTTFDVGIDCTTVSTDDVKMSGFNRFSVANSTLNDKYTLQTVSISSTVYEVRAFKVPWSSIQPILTTSELTNVSITSKTNYVSEELTETIEIINGAGKLNNSFYDLLSYNYGSRINLGAPTIKEDGQITTAISENSMLTITYVTRFWSWEVKDTDIEDVQFILLTDES